MQNHVLLFKKNHFFKSYYFFFFLFQLFLRVANYLIVLYCLLLKINRCCFLSGKYVSANSIGKNEFTDINYKFFTETHFG